MSEIEKCKKCGQNFNIDITGEYPCPDCGIPTIHDEIPEDISDTRERSNLYFGILKIIKKLKLEHIDKDQYDHPSIAYELEQFYKYNFEQQNKELRELLNYAMVILMNHEQSYDEDWIKDYQSCCQIYEQIIT